MDTISQQLKDAIRQSGAPIGPLAAACGLHRQMIDRFLSGERDIRMETADKLAAYFGLKLVTDQPPKPAKKRKGP